MNPKKELLWGLWAGPLCHGCGAFAFHGPGRSLEHPAHRVELWRNFLKIGDPKIAP